MTDSSPTQDFEGASFYRTNFRGAVFRGCDFSAVTMRSVDVGG
ncbi:MAG: DinB family protein, partial [Actinomyces sp.]